MKHSILKLICIFFLLISCSKSTERYKIRLTKTMQNHLERLIRFRNYPYSSHLDLKVLNEAENQIILYSEIEKELVVSGVKSQDISFGRSKVRIGLIDRNNDGVYNQIGIDGLLLGRYMKEELFIDELVENVGYFRTVNQFSIDNITYEILTIEKDGSKIEFRETNKTEEKYLVAKYDSLLPRLVLKDNSGKKILLWNLKEPGKKLLVVISNRRKSDEAQVLKKGLEKYGNRLKAIILKIDSKFDKSSRAYNPKGIGIYEVGPELCHYKLCGTFENNNIVMLVHPNGFIEEQVTVDLEHYLKKLEL